MYIGFGEDVPYQGLPSPTAGDVCERLITQLHARRYRNVLRYLVLYQEEDGGRLVAKAEHPVRAEWLAGFGRTWPETLAELLRQVEKKTSDG